MRNNIQHYSCFDQNYLAQFQNADFNFVIEALKQRIGNPPKLFRNTVLLAEDPLFVFRGNPAYEHHDALGYKNSCINVVNSLDILCLGNSQVHQLYAPPEETWPNILMQRSGFTVYNAAMGSFSPIQYHLALLELVFSKPKVCLVSFYCPLNATNSVNSLNKIPHVITEQYSENMKENIPLQYKPNKEAILKLNKVDGATRIKMISSLNAQSDYTVLPVKVGQTSYFITPAHRAVSQDLDDEFVQYGLSLALRALELLFALAKSNGIEVGLILIPSKEYVIYHRAEKNGDVSLEFFDDLAILGGVEKRISERVMTFSSNSSIPFINLVEGLSERIDEPIFPYPNIGSHPSLLGREFIADLVQRWVFANFRGVFPMPPSPLSA